MSKQSIFEEMVPDASKAMENWAIMTNADIIAGRLGYQSIENTAVDTIEVRGLKRVKRFKMRKGTFRAGIVAEAIFKERGCIPGVATSASIAITEDIMDKIKIAMGESVWTLAEKELSPDEHFTAALRQLAGPLILRVIWKQADEESAAA